MSCKYKTVWNLFFDKWGPEEVNITCTATVDDNQEDVF